MSKSIKRIVAGALGILPLLFLSSFVGCSEKVKEKSEVTAEFNGHTGVQLWKDGPYWAEENIGAKKKNLIIMYQWDCGLYFWWGDTVGHKSSGFTFNERNTPTHNKDLSKLQSEGWVTADGVLAPAHDAAQVLWGGGWRMPTKQEISDLCEKCSWYRYAKSQTGQKQGAYCVTGKGVYGRAEIFLPLGGNVHDSMQDNLNDVCVSYWSSEPYSSDRLDLAFGISTTGFNEGKCATYLRSIGMPIRPVHDPVKK